MDKQQLHDEIRQLQVHLGGRLKNEDSANLNAVLTYYKDELNEKNAQINSLLHELESARESYADLYGFAPVAYISFDEDGVIKNINLTGSGLLATDRAQLIGCHFHSWVVKSDLSSFIEHLRTVLQSDIYSTVEIKIRDHAGCMRDIRIDSVRNKDAISDSYLCRSIMLDITENNRNRDEVALQARQLTLITDALPVLISYIDIDERHTFVNKTYGDWFGKANDDVLGKSMREIWGEQGYLNINKYFNVCLSGKQITFDMEAQSIDGEKKHINTIFIPDIDGDDCVHGVIALMGDITDKMASEMIDRKRLLESVHFSRLRTMGEMASEIAHELNQPLAAISIFSDACRRLILSGKGRQEILVQSLNDIGEQAERAGEVIRRIREFTSKNELKFSENSINDIVREALHLITIELKTHSVRLRLELGSFLPAIMADRILIEQVLLNLARNALEAMEEVDVSERVLTIQTLVLRQKELEVNIIDTGPGLPVDHQKKVFEPFHTTKTTGMGMGLAICQTIVEAHRGRLWAVENQYNGTTFSFTLPLVVEGEYESI